MKFNKLNIAVLFLMTAFFAGCDDFNDKVEPSPVVPDGSPAVIFTSENASHFELEPSVSLEFTLMVSRDNEAASLEVPITAVINTENSFVVPSSVTFDAGSKTASLTIKMADGAPMGIDLPLAIKMDESLANPYKTEYSTYYGSVLIPDWETYATGIYSSWWFEVSYAQVLEYSPVLDQYRFADLMADGYDFIFTWDGASDIAPVPAKVESGDVHPTYGMVSATTNAATYDAASKTFTFTRKWTVDAGSFGEGDDTYTMD